MKATLKISSMVFMTVFLAGWAFCDAETTEFTTGKVVKVIENGFVLDESDFTQDKKDQATQYFLDEKVKLKHMSTLGDVNGGDELDVLYYQKNDKRIAILVTLIKD